MERGVERDRGGERKEMEPLEPTPQNKSMERSKTKNQEKVRRKKWIFTGAQREIYYICIPMRKAIMRACELPTELSERKLKNRFEL